MQIRKQLKHLFLVLLCVTYQINAQIPTLTAEQLSLLQSLPRAQQQALFEQYGAMLELEGPSLEENDFEEAAPITARNLNIEKLLSSVLKQDNEKDESVPLERFGLSLFAGFPNSFTPLDTVPVVKGYVIGPGDQIIIQLYGKENKEYKLRVQRDGNIHFPNLGSMSIAGMNFEQMQGFLTKRIEEQFIGVRSNINLGELRSMQIFILGDAYKPGTYSVSALTTISQAVYLNGGFSQTGALRNVQLKRQGKVITTLDMYDLLLKGETQNDLRLQPGDTVFIHAVGDTITVQGEVNRPAIYELKPNENLQDIIQMAGGLTRDALIENVRIQRQSKNGASHILTANLSKDKSLAIAANDDIQVVKRGNQLNDYIDIQGDVVNPGLFQWKEGMRVSDIFPSLEHAFYDTTDLSYALIVRTDSETRQIKVLSFDISKALLEPNTQDDLLLDAKDKILVFNRLELIEQVELQETKNLEQAQAQSAQEKDQIDRALSEEAELSNENLEFASKQDTEEDKKKQRQVLSSRKNLLAPILQQLEQQSSYKHPELIAEIIGEVKIPGRYPITQGAKIEDLIKAAGGLTAKAFTNNAELSRRVVNDNDKISIRTLFINLDQALKQESQNNLLLQARDKLTVLQKSGFNQLEKTITLQGEVTFPGIYSVSSDETLSDLIARAGGLTEYANAKGAIFTRETLRLQEEELLRTYVNDIRKETVNKVLNAHSTNSSSILANPERTLALIEEASTSKALGRMVIELDELLAQNKAADFLIEDGDFLFIPRFKNTISVVGEVQVAITYLLDEELTVTDYINKAGGLKKQADEERIFVIRANGSVYKPQKVYWFNRNAQTLKAGDTIIVPLDTNYRDSLTLWESATQILYQTGVAVNALRR